MTEEEQERERFDAEHYFEGTEIADRLSTKRAYLVRASKWMHDHAEGYRTDPHCAESLVGEFLQIEKEVTLRWLAPMECGHATCYQQLKPSEDGRSIEKICLVCTPAAPKPAPPAEPDARFEAHTKAVADFLNELYAIMVDPLPDGPIKVAEMQRALLEAAKRDREYSHFINYYNVEATARLALERWRMKPHNAKWWKKIDGTPIPNDLIVCISEDIAVSLRRAAERKPPR